MTKFNSLRFDYQKLEEFVADSGQPMIAALNQRTSLSARYYAARKESDLPLRYAIAHLFRHLKLLPAEIATCFKHGKFDYDTLEHLIQSRGLSIREAFADEPQLRRAYYKTRSKDELPLQTAIAHLITHLQLSPDQIAQLFITRR